MSVEVAKDVLLLPISHKTDRLEEIFKDVKPSRIYVISNQNPRGMDKEQNNKILQMTEEIVKKSYSSKR